MSRPAKSKTPQRSRISCRSAAFLFALRYPAKPRPVTRAGLFTFRPVKSNLPRPPAGKWQGLIHLAAQYRQRSSQADCPLAKRCTSGATSRA
nr:MAG TPA: hypothetical protein [Caudoviricetes sp.]